MEIWDLYTKDRIKTEETMVRGEKITKGFYRLVVHVCIFNSRGEMLIQQRQPFKKSLVKYVGYYCWWQCYFW